MAFESFSDRKYAGRALAKRLAKLAGRSDVTVLALPRGGTPVAYEVAKALHAPLAGKRAPERNHIGMRNKFMMAWNPWVEFIRHAMQNPKAVSANETTPIITIASTHPASGGVMPSRGLRRTKISPCTKASAVPPRTLPSTIAIRGTAATSTDCKTPSRRSSITEIVEKIAVNSRIITIVPGKKYSMYPRSPVTPPPEKLWPIPAPMSSQNTIGVASAPITRFGWRTNRTSSRWAKEIAGRNCITVSL